MLIRTMPSIPRLPILPLESMGDIVTKSTELDLLKCYVELPALEGGHNVPIATFIIVEPGVLNTRLIDMM